MDKFEPFPDRPQRYGHQIFRDSNRKFKNDFTGKHWEVRIELEHASSSRFQKKNARRKMKPNARANWIYILLRTSAKMTGSRCCRFQLHFRNLSKSCCTQNIIIYIGSGELALSEKSSQLALQLHYNLIPRRRAVWTCRKTMPDRENFCVQYQTRRKQATTVMRNTNSSMYREEQGSK